MRALFILSKQDIELAKDEVLALAKTKAFELDENILMIDKKLTFSKLADRLAYTRQISELLFCCSHDDLAGALENFPWNTIYKKDFSLKIKNSSKMKLAYDEKRLSGYIWRAVNDPKVKLRNAETKIELFFTKNKVYCTRFLYKVEGEFEKRKAHKRPKLHPTAMHPKLARAIINLTGIRSGTIIDPFCGSGGILIEAGLIGLKSEGYDIDPMMLARAKINLKHFNIENCILKEKDATKIKKSMDYIATDLPYGRNSKAEELEKLYLSFLKNLKKRLRKSAVVSFPDFVDYKKVIEKSGFKIHKEYDYYLHRSLSKKIIVI